MNKVILKWMEIIGNHDNFSDSEIEEVFSTMDKQGFFTGDENFADFLRSLKNHQRLRTIFINTLSPS